MAPGQYQLRLALRDPSGHDLVTKTLAFKKVAASEPRPTVYVDEYNRLVVRGKPFFPLGLYSRDGPTAKELHGDIDRIAAAQFNTIIDYNITLGKSPDEVRSELDYLDSHGLKLLFSLITNYRVLAGYRDPVLGLSGQDEITRGVTSAFSNHPALLGWYLNDERPPTMRDRLEARYREMCALDPNHPTLSVLNEIPEIGSYLGTTDVIATDPYPVPMHAVTQVADWTRAAVAASGGRRPAWEVIQIFDWDIYKKNQPIQMRAPSLGEILVMSYLALIHGARGLIYYSYFDLQRDRSGFDRRWTDVVLVLKEMQRLTPALLSAKDIPRIEVRSNGSGIETSTRVDDAGNAYVLMANTGNAAGVVSVTPPAHARLRLLREGGDQTLPSVAVGQTYEVEMGAMSAATLIMAAR